jgi:hypothetical protein
MSGTIKLSVDLSRLPGEDHKAHIDRVAHMHQLPGRVQPRHQDAVEQPGADKISASELAALERASEANGAEALLKLRPKAHPKKVRRVK